MNILHLTTYLQGGAGRVVVDLAEESIVRGGAAKVVTTKTEYPGYGNYTEYFNRLTKIQIEVYHIDSLFKRDELLNERVIQSISNKLKDGNFDIIHTHAAIPSMIAKKAIKRTGLNIPVIQSMQGWGTNKTAEHERQDLDILNTLDRVVAVSKASRRLLVKKGVRRDLIEVIPNGVEEEITDDWSLSKKDLEEIEKLRSAGKILIGCIGTICERKNQKTLVQAVIQLNKVGYATSLLLVGEDELKGECQKIARANGMDQNISVIGYRSNARSFLKHVDVFCLPTLAEGSPLAVMEAFCDGAPVIGSNILEIKEMIDDCKNGFLCDPNDLQSIAEVLLKSIDLSNHEKSQLTGRAREVFERKYSRNVMIQKYFELYKRVVSIF